MSKSLIESQNSAKVSATLSSVVRDPFNWLMVLALLIWIGFWASLFFIGHIPVALVSLCLGLAGLFLYLWGILTRTFAVNPIGIIYTEAFRKVIIAWDEIDAVLIENEKKQITFYLHGKKVRIHAFGLHPRYLPTLGSVFFNELKERNITITNLP